MDDSILLESGERVIVAVPQGEPCVFNKPRLEFIRPKWTEDGDAVQCLQCKQKFTQLRRKHHCRCCGRLFCSKCCNDKTVLTHLGMSDAERTCVICRPILTLMTACYSSNVKDKTDAAVGFHELIQNMKHMQEVLELGGLHMLIWLCGTNSAQLYKHIVSALHILATQVSLQAYLLKAGVVQALSSIMQNTDPSNRLITDCISTLRILSNRPESAQQVVLYGGLSSLLSNISRVDDELTTLLTLQTIMGMSKVPESHSQIMSNVHTIRYLTQLVIKGQDSQVRTLIFSIFSEISAGQSLHHKIILSEVESSSEYISKSLRSVQSDELLLSNITCLLANLASTAETQSHLVALVSRVGALTSDSTKPYYRHVIRALANFSQFSQHSFNLINYIPKVICGMKSVTHQQTQNQSLRLLTNLLSQSPEEASGLICRADGELFLTKLMLTPGIATAITGVLNDGSADVSGL